MQKENESNLLNNQNDIEFTVYYRNNSLKIYLNKTDSLSKLYSQCSSLLKLTPRSFSLHYKGFNLNFFDKNYQIAKIIQKWDAINTDGIIIIIFAQINKRKDEVDIAEEKSFYLNGNHQQCLKYFNISKYCFPSSIIHKHLKQLTYEKGSLFYLIRIIPSGVHINLDELIIPGKNISNYEILRFFDYFNDIISAKVINISLTYLCYLDQLKLGHQFEMISNAEKITINNHISRYVDIICDDALSRCKYQKILSNLQFPHLHYLSLENCMIETLETILSSSISLYKLSLKNVLNQSRKMINCGKLSKLETLKLDYEKLGDLLDILISFSLILPESNLLVRILYDCSDSRDCLKLSMLGGLNVVALANKLELELKCRLSLENEDDCLLSFSNRISELKLELYNNFDDIEFERLFEANTWQSLNSLIIRNHSISTKKITQFLKQYNKLRYLDISLAYNPDEVSYNDSALMLSKVGRFTYCDNFNCKGITNLMNSFLLNANVVLHNLQKIHFPQLELCKSRKMLTLHGAASREFFDEPFLTFFEMLSNSAVRCDIESIYIEDFEINENILIFNRLLELCSNLSALKFIHIEQCSFNKENSKALKKILWINSEGIEAIELKSLKFAFHELKMLFYFELFNEMSFPSLDKISMSSTEWDLGVQKVICHPNIFTQIKFLSFCSIDPFPLFDHLASKDSYIYLPNLIGVSLKDLPISLSALEQFLLRYKDQLICLTLDLNVAITTIIEHMVFPNLVKLKVLEGFISYSDTQKMSMLEAMANCTKLKFLPFSFKSLSKDSISHISKLFKFINC